MARLFNLVVCVLHELRQERDTLEKHGQELVTNRLTKLSTVANAARRTAALSPRDFVSTVQYWLP